MSQPTPTEQQRAGETAPAPPADGRAALSGLLSAAAGIGVAELAAAARA